VYDSISSNVWRRVRRRWPVLLVVALLGGVLGFAMSNLGSGTQTGRANFRFASLVEAASVLDLERITDVDVSTVATQARLDYDLAPASERPATVFRADGGARTISVTVTGATKQEVEDAVDRIAATVTELAVKPRVDQTDLALATVGAEIDAITTQLADIDDAISKVGANDVTLPALLLQRLEVDRDLVEATSRRSSLTALRDYAANTMFSRSKVSFADTSASITTPIAAGLGALLLSIGVILGLVLVDRRVRRRMHLEDAAPDATVLGVVPARDSMEEDERRAFQSVVREFVRRNGIQVLSIASVAADGSETDVGDLLGGMEDVEISIWHGPAAHALAGVSGGRSVGCVVVVPWGKVSQEQLSSALADLRAGAPSALGLVLGGVPRADLAWAGASTYGSLIETAS
jgi:hypothetical protein